MLVLLVWIACVCCGLANMAPSRIVGWYRWVTAPLFPYRNLEWLISVLPKLVKYNQLWMPLLKHWWRMPWIVINIVTCRIPWINWILNMDCAARVSFASTPAAYIEYCAQAYDCAECTSRAHCPDMHFRAHHLRFVLLVRLLCSVGHCPLFWHTAIMM